MGFPNETLIDDFTRPNENPIVRGYANYPLYAGVSLCELNSNKLRSLGASDGHVVYNSWFGADCAFYIKIDNWTGFTAVGVVARGAGANSSSPTYYGVTAIKSGNVFNLDKVVSGTETNLGSITQALASGNSIGIVCHGTSIKGWYRSGASDWTELLDVSDSAITAGGFVSIPLGVSDRTTALISEFGGGNLSPNASRRSWIFV